MSLGTILIIILIIFLLGGFVAGSEDMDTALDMAVLA